MKTAKDYLESIKHGLLEFEIQEISKLMEAYANDKLSQFTERQELAVTAHHNHVKIIKQLKASMALESSKCIQSLEMKDQRIKELEERLKAAQKERDYWEQDRNEINAMWTRRYKQVTEK